MIRTFRHESYDPRELAARKEGSVSVVLPARDEEATVGEIVRAVRTLGDLVDEVVVIDSGSTDRTPEVARAAGARVHAQDELVPGLGGSRGKGDAMWRALSVVRGDYVCYLDADTLDFEPHFVTGLLGPLVEEPAVQFVKGGFRRPFTGRGEDLPDEGGRVTELCARPLLTAFFPALARLRQPLAGEIAARRPLLEELPFATGFGVDIAMLIDAYERAGDDGIAEAWLGQRRQPHKALIDLGPMAYAVLAAILRRSGAGPDELLPYRTPDGRVVPLEYEERPPFATLRASA